MRLRFLSVPFLRWTTWLALALLVVGVIYQIGKRVGQGEEQRQSDAMRRAVEVNTLAVRGVVEKYKYLPFTVAQHPDITYALRQPGDLAGVARANRYLQGINLRAESNVLYVLNRQGMTINASNWDQPDSFVGKDYSVRPYFTEALRGATGFFYGVGKDTGEPGLFLAAPVKGGSAVIGVVAVKVSLAEIDATWKDSGTPTLLSDSLGVVFLGSAEPLVNLGLGKQRTYLLKRQLSPVQNQWLQDHYVYGREVALGKVPWIEVPAQPDGSVAESYFVRSTHTQPRTFLAMDHAVFDVKDPYHALGWTLTVMADYAPVVRERNNAWISASLAASLLLMVALYWRARERRFREVQHASQELERRVLERTSELGEAHAFRKAMEDSLLVGMRARDLEGRIIYVNPAHAQITGYGAQELMGKLPPYAYWHPEDVDQHWHNSDAALRGQSALSGWESRLRHKDGHDVHTMVYTAPLIDAAGRHSGWMSSVVDITQQKKDEALQRQQLEQLQHAQRLASMGEMASIVGHELNQPLEAMGNFASAAKDFAEQNNLSMLRSSLSEIQQQIQRAADILKRIKTIGKRQTPGPSPTQLNTVAQHVLTWLAPQIHHWQARVEIRFDPALVPVLADAVLIEQVVLNLVINALQAMAALPVEQRLVEIETAQDANQVVLRVRDHGPGVKDGMASRIFDPFFTTKAEGLGLGLNICRTIVEGHRGSLTVHNSAGGGAIFTLQLEAAP
jgi:PAS domain S-box-containing protein